MLTWCANRLTFSGDQKNFRRVISLFGRMAKKSQQQMLGQLPGFVPKEHKHFYNIRFEDRDILFDTKYMPDHAALILIADHFGLDFRNQYREPGMFLHGEANYRNGKLEDIYLDGYDMDRYAFEGDQFWYQNTPYQKEEEVIDLLVANKKAELAAGQFMQEAYAENFFVTKSQVSREEVAALYIDPPEGVLLLRLAELKNFEAARAIFDSWSEENVTLMENYCIQEFQHLPRLNYSPEQYIALRFLDHLLTGWRQQHRIDYEDHPFLTRPDNEPDEFNLGR